jgi:hypothetical protein
MEKSRCWKFYSNFLHLQFLYTILNPRIRIISALIPARPPLPSRRTFLKTLGLLGLTACSPPAVDEDYWIGCILLSQPFFLEEADWIPVPKNWSPNIVQGKTYDLTVEPGLSLYQQLQERLALPSPETTLQPILEKPAERYGTPIEILPRLGQGSFRVVVIDAYGRMCAVTGEKACPPSDEHRRSCPRGASPLGSVL